MIYFDHNATTPLDGRVLAAMLPFLETFFGNPSSLYRHGRIAKSAVDTAREQVASLLGAPSGQVVFTSGGTEANHLALAVAKPNSRLALSAIEHPSVLQKARQMQLGDHELMLMAVDSSGLLTDEAVDRLNAFNPGFVSIMYANNETGVIQPIARIAAQLKERNILVHTDAVQAMGKLPIDFVGLGVDLLSVSSHKIYGPKGCGALVFAKGVALNPLLVGGKQEQDYRAGTENVAAIVGFGKAAELAQLELAERAEKTLALRNMLESALKSLPGVTIFAEHSHRLPNTVQFGIDGVDGEMLLMRLDQKGIAVSSGSACASGGSEPSPVLLAMGVAPEQAKTAVRISLGKDNTEADILEFIHCLKSLLHLI